MCATRCVIVVYKTTGKTALVGVKMETVAYSSLLRSMGVLTVTLFLKKWQMARVGQLVDERKADKTVSSLNQSKFIW